MVAILESVARMLAARSHDSRTSSVLEQISCSIIKSTTKRATLKWVDRAFGLVTVPLLVGRIVMAFAVGKAVEVRGIVVGRAVDTEDREQAGAAERMILVSACFEQVGVASAVVIGIRIRRRRSVALVEELLIIILFIGFVVGRSVQIFPFALLEEEF